MNRRAMEMIWSIIIGGVIAALVVVLYANPQILGSFKKLGDIIPGHNNTLPLQESLDIVRYTVSDGTIASYDGERWVTMTSRTQFGNEIYDPVILRKNFDYYYFFQDRDYSRDVGFDLGGKLVYYIPTDFKKELSDNDWKERSFTKVFSETLFDEFGSIPLKLSLVSIVPSSDLDSSEGVPWYKNIPLPYDWDPQYITSMYNADKREGGRGDAYYYLYSFDEKTKDLTKPAGKIIVRAYSGKIYFVRNLVEPAYPENDGFSESSSVLSIKRHLLLWEQDVLTQPVKIESSTGTRYYCVELLDGNLVIRLNNSTTANVVCKQ